MKKYLTMLILTCTCLTNWLAVKTRIWLLTRYFCYFKHYLSHFLLLKDFPFEDNITREKMVFEGQFILTEAEIALDAADTLRFGRDIFVTLSHVCIRQWHAPTYPVYCTY